MKKAAAWFFLLAWTVCPLLSQTPERAEICSDGKKYITLGINSGLFFAQDTVFREIYGTSVPFLFPQFSFRFSLRDDHGLEFLLGSRIIQTEGKTSYTEERARLRIVSLTFSGRYSFEIGKLSLFLGPGLDLIMYKETYAETFPVDYVDGNLTGFHMTVGGYYHFMPVLSLKAYFQYCVAKTEDPGFRVNLGGSEWGVGLIYRFCF